MAYKFQIDISTTFSGTTGTTPTAGGGDYEYEYLYLISTGSTLSAANSTLSGGSYSNKVLSCPGHASQSILITASTTSVYATVAAIRPGSSFAFSSGKMIYSSYASNHFDVSCYVQPKFSGDKGSYYLTDTIIWFKLYKQYPYYIKQICSNNWYKNGSMVSPGTETQTKPVYVAFTGKYVTMSNAGTAGFSFPTSVTDGLTYGANKLALDRQIRFKLDGTVKWNSTDAMVKPNGYNLSVPGTSFDISVTNNGYNEVDVAVQLWVRVYGGTSSTEIMTTYADIVANSYTTGYGTLVNVYGGTSINGVIEVGLCVREYNQMAAWNASIGNLYFSGIGDGTVYWKTLDDDISINSLQISIN